MESSIEGNSRSASAASRILDGLIPGLKKCSYAFLELCTVYQRCVCQAHIDELDEFSWRLQRRFNHSGGDKFVWEGDKMEVRV